jgi:hypothetical protein
MNDKQNLFLQNTRYRVKQPFSERLWDSWAFKQDEVLRFVRSYYSFYDGLYIYEFLSELDSLTKFWALPDKQEVETWKDFFEVADR